MPPGQSPLAGYTGSHPHEEIKQKPSTRSRGASQFDRQVRDRIADSATTFSCSFAGCKPGCKVSATESNSTPQRWLHDAEQNPRNRFGRAGGQAVAGSILSPRFLRKACSEICHGAERHAATRRARSRSGYLERTAGQRVRQPGHLEEEKYARRPRPGASARVQCPNQRARRKAPNCSFSAAYSSAGS